MASERELSGAINTPFVLQTGETTRITIAGCKPIFRAPTRPGSHRWIPIENLYAYIVRPGNGQVAVERFQLFGGRLHEQPAVETDPPLPIELARGEQVWLYFSHRFDFIQTLFTPEAKTQRLFQLAGGGLPLQGPIAIPAGDGDPEIDVDIWAQNDWLLVPAHGFEREPPDKVMLVPSRDDYEIGRYNADKTRFYPWTEPARRDKQTVWPKLGAPYELVEFRSTGSGRRWLATLSDLPGPQNKATLLLKKSGVVVSSHSKLDTPAGNVTLPGHHLYDQPLVRQLLAIHPCEPLAARVDALPPPPVACHLPGDIPWHSQGQTPNCGPYALAGAVNYWFPLTHHPHGRDGAWFAERTPSGPGGSRSPGQLRDALLEVAELRALGLHTRDNDADNLSRAQALKLLKLWIHAGVPVIVLVKEREWHAAINALMTYHWKLLLGYDRERFFFLNSGAEREVDVAFRQDRVEYEHAPVGNDVDSADHFYEKWHRAGGDLVDAFSDVDRCTYLPILPMDARFGAIPADAVKVTFLGFRLTRARRGRDNEKLNLSISVFGQPIFEVNAQRFRVLRNGACFQNVGREVVETGDPSDLAGWDSQVVQSVVVRPLNTGIRIDCYCSRSEDVDRPGVMIAAISRCFPIGTDRPCFVDIPLSNGERGEHQIEALVRFRVDPPIETTVPATSWETVV